MDYRHSMAAQYHGLGTLYMDRGQPDGALAPLKKAIAIGEKLVQRTLIANPDVVNHVVLLAESYRRMARFENGRGRPQAVLAWTDKGIQTPQRVIAVEPRRSQARWALNDLRIGRGVALAQMGDHAGAAKVAGEMAREEGLSPVDVYNVACVHSRCSEAAGKDARLAPAVRIELREQHATRAVENPAPGCRPGFQGRDCHQDRDGLRAAAGSPGLQEAAARDGGKTGPTGCGEINQSSRRPDSSERWT